MRAGEPDPFVRLLVAHCDAISIIFAGTQDLIRLDKTESDVIRNAPTLVAAPRTGDSGHASGVAVAG